MPVIMQLERWPRTRKTPQLIREELERSYASIMWPAMEKDFKKDVSDWVDPPRFYYTMSVSGRLYRFQARVDARTRGGKHYVWVDQGTIDKGDKSGPGKVVTVKNAPFMVFTTPYQPKTIPETGVTYDINAPRQFHKRKVVTMHGIKPREFSKKILAKYKDRSNPQGFYLVTKNAYRRAFRRIPKTG